ncbi:hypothetical protein DPMN_037916 [Dreissena polymorpha]|uniref:Uncharacterized protein n=1 Tax=Dreissena polymorpha TaxID=45954 RepID=A0A9D4RQ81_DREPO|nr:hypothetical protein DPMN_037916 [Dreissena polymorpha]
MAYKSPGAADASDCTDSTDSCHPGLPGSPRSPRVTCGPFHAMWDNTKQTCRAMWDNTKQTCRAIWDNTKQTCRVHRLYGTTLNRHAECIGYMGQHFTDMQSA